MVHSRWCCILNRRESLFDLKEWKNFDEEDDDYDDLDYSLISLICRHFYLIGKDWIFLKILNLQIPPYLVITFKSNFTSVYHGRRKSVLLDLG